MCLCSLVENEEERTEEEPADPTRRVVQCRYLGRHRQQCTAEAVDDQADVLLCTKHLARVMLLLSIRGFTVTPPAK
jgi:hypothetical protein